MSIYLEVMAIAGDTIGDVLAEMRDLADHLGITIRTTFNGVPIILHPGADIARMEGKFMEVSRGPVEGRWYGVSG